VTPARHGAAPFRFISSWFNRIPLTIRLPYLATRHNVFAKLTGYRGQYMMIAMPERQMRPPTKSKRSGVMRSTCHPQSIESTINHPP
jgi:hypothetical protein